MKLHFLYNIISNNNSNHKCIYVFERGELRKAILKALIEWNYQIERANPYNIAKKLGISESSVTKILRAMKDEKIVKKSSHGSWAVI